MLPKFPVALHELLTISLLKPLKLKKSKLKDKTRRGNANKLEVLENTQQYKLTH